MFCTTGLEVSTTQTKNHTRRRLPTHGFLHGSENGHRKQDDLNRTVVREREGHRVGGVECGMVTSWRLTCRWPSVILYAIWSTHNLCCWNSSFGRNDEWDENGSCSWCNVTGIAHCKLGHTEASTPIRFSSLSETTPKHRRWRVLGWSSRPHHDDYHVDAYMLFVPSAWTCST